MTMDKQNIVSFNSPIIQKNTPIKRLGLSRKRKSSDPAINLSWKIQAVDENLPSSSNNSEKKLSSEDVVSTPKNSANMVTDSGINYDEEIDLSLKRIAEIEEKIKAFDCVKDKILKLEELIELWKNGCKNAFLYFRQLLRERESENIDLKSVLNNLGIWEVMLENFSDDNEISLLDYEQ